MLSANSGITCGEIAKHLSEQAFAAAGVIPCHESFFCAPAAGCHIYFGKSKMGLSFGIGYNLQLAKVYYSYGSEYPINENFGGVSISVAFDF